jgi:hypothetical protein
LHALARPAHARVEACRFSYLLPVRVAACSGHFPLFMRLEPYPITRANPELASVTSVSHYGKRPSVTGIRRTSPRKLRFTRNRVLIQVKKLFDSELTVRYGGMLSAIWIQARVPIVRLLLSTCPEGLTVAAIATKLEVRMLCSVVPTGTTEERGWSTLGAKAPSSGI